MAEEMILLKTRNAKVRIRSVADKLVDIGYRIADLRTIGEDPEMHCIRGFVIGYDPNAAWDDRYAVWSFFDWSVHPNPGDRRRGTDIQHGHYHMSRDEAFRFADEQSSELLRNNTWLIPGTKDRVPGCWGDRR